jgi:hypothetical protein
VGSSSQHLLFTRLLTEQTDFVFFKTLQVACGVFVLNLYALSGLSCHEVVKPPTEQANNGKIT